MNPIFKKCYKLITRLLCPLCLVMFGFIAYDIVMPATQTDEATVTGKTKHFAKGGYSYFVHGQGKYRYNEEISRPLYERLEKGDTLRVSLSHFFSEWKTLEIERNGNVYARTRGNDLYWMGLFGILFLLSAAAYLPDQLLFEKMVVVVMLPVVNFAAVLLLLRFIQLWTGQIDKM